jgi:toxin FitB
MIVLDTNVASAMMGPRRDRAFDRWSAEQDPQLLYVTSMTVQELFFGMHEAKSESHRTELSERIEQFFRNFIQGRVLDFDRPSAEICGRLMHAKRAFTPLLKIVDIQIAATAMCHGFAVATRDVSDFQHEGLRVINPWD